MRKRTLPWLGLLLWLAVPVAVADDDLLEDHPGYFPLEELGLLEADELTLEVNLHAPMLKLVAAATRKSDADFAQLVEGLQAVRVRIAEIDSKNTDKVQADIAGAGRWLRERGWQTIVRTQDDDEQIHIYLRQEGDRIHGLAILALDGGEVTAINIAGPIDLSKLGSLAQKLDIPLLSEAVPERSETKKDESKKDESEKDEPEKEP